MNTLLIDYQKNLHGFHSRIDTELTILLYHGVTGHTSQGIENYSRKHIMEDDFYRQMQYLSEYCNVLAIDDYLALRVNKKPLPPRAVIISFDDGFRNNFTTAAPILEEFSLPAVFYISSGIVNTDLMFWVDVIEDCLNFVRKGTVKIQLNEKYDFSLNTEQEKLKALDTIKSYCKNSSVAEKNRVIDDIQSITRVTASVTHSPNYEKVSWRELQQIHANSLFAIGGHSTYHQILSALDTQHAEREIRTSIELLQLNLNTQVEHYSYPEGQPQHYNGAVIDILKKHGVVCCPSAIPGLNSIDEDLFQLRRIMVGFSNLPFPYWDKSI